MESMRAVRLHQRGGPDCFTFEDVPVPAPAIGDALVRVEAASFTPTELDWPSTWVDRAGRDRLPVIPCHELSGVVTALGYGTTGVGIGQPVYGLGDWYRDGAAAEYVLVEARSLAAKPTTLAHTEAAACSLAGLTAWQALFRHARLREGQSVLVHGAAGGVGSFAVQLAHVAGATVVGTGRSDGGDLVRSLGADDFVDVDHERFEDAVKGVDVVLDFVGGDTLRRSWEVLRPGGVVVSVVEPVTPPSGARGVFFVVEPDGRDLTDLAGSLDRGQIHPLVGSVVALSAAGDAFEAKQRGGAPGKSVLAVGTSVRV